MHLYIYIKQFTDSICNTYAGPRRANSEIFAAQGVVTFELIESIDDRGKHFRDGTEKADRVILHRR